jgi:hypothetical protein
MMDMGDIIPIIIALIIMPIIMLIILSHTTNELYDV